MIDENGKFVLLTLDDARAIVLKNAALAGVEVLAGSVEDQQKEWQARNYLDFDTAEYLSYVKQTNPTGSDIDIQNPIFPRRDAEKSQGYLEIDNTGGSEVLSIPVDTIFTAPNGVTYTNPNDALTVAIDEIKTLYITSVETGPGTNLPPGQTFTGLPSGLVTNPQPLVGGRNKEDDTEYLNRLTEEKTNHVGQQTSVAVVSALQEFYDGARIYINNQITAAETPIPVPANGYNLVILFPSGVNASPAEIQKALDVIKSRLEFVNVNAVTDAPRHLTITGVIFSGAFPQNYSITVAQGIKATIDCTLEVSFAPNVSNAEKISLVQTLTQNFVQRIMNTLGGANGNFTGTFDPLTGADIPLNLSVVGVQPSNIVIAPYLSIEDVRALTIDSGDILKTPNIMLKKIDALTVELDPEVVGESAVTLNIDGPVSFVEFSKDELYTNNTSWYDRYIFIDPSLITIDVNEVA